MGVRHAQGIIGLGFVTKIFLADRIEEALSNAKKTLSQHDTGNKCEYLSIDDIEKVKGKVDVCIIAATAADRIGMCRIAIESGCANLLVEKPLGQSLEEVRTLTEFLSKQKINNAVNLNMRLYSSFVKLKNDLALLPQFQGEKTITINTGTLGIGANGIHYLDLLYFLLEADKAEVVAAEIDQNIIPSGRGSNFGDFGGWAAIKLFKGERYLGKALISMSSDSTVFGSWDIVGKHGRISLNEVEQKRVDVLRKADSEMPINRYAADYMPPVESKFESPFLGDLTASWLQGIQDGKQLLPSVTESYKVHELMFKWLSFSKTHKEIFPIT